MTSQEMIDLCKKHTMYTWAAGDQVAPLPIARAEGVYLYTPEGKRILEREVQVAAARVRQELERW